MTEDSASAGELGEVERAVAAGAGPAIVGLVALSVEVEVVLEENGRRSGPFSDRLYAQTDGLHEGFVKRARRMKRLLASASDHELERSSLREGNGGGVPPSDFKPGVRDSLADGAPGWMPGAGKWYNYL